MEINDIFVEAVKERIQSFNKTRGRRKELSPEFVVNIPLPNRKYGRIVQWSDSPMPDITHRLIPHMAEVTVRTMLRLRSRPHILTVGMFENKANGEYLIRFKIPTN